ncbi:MAG: hypothetical protein AAB152_14195 [Candidatus Coatesbacteria bacterium]
MKATSPIRLASLLAGLAAGLSRPAAAGLGITTNFVEVLVEDVPAGSRYAITEKLVDVKNNSDVALRIRFEAEEPSAGLMRPGYEPIPDPAWVGFEPRTVEVKPGETVTAKAVLNVPDDPEYVGKRFQVMVWIHPVEGAGTLGISVGLKPRLLFSIAPKGRPGGPKLTNLPRKLAVAKPYVSGGVAKEIVIECDPVVVENHQDAPVTYEFVPGPAAPKRLDLRPGDLLMDPEWVEVSPRTVILPPLKGTQLAVRARIPIGAAQFGRIYMGSLHLVATRTGNKPVEIWNVVRVSLPMLSGTNMAGSGTTFR